MIATRVLVPAQDHCLGFFATLYEAGRIPIPQGGKVLEVGSAEADWLTPFKTARPDVHLTGVDQRTCQTENDTRKDRNPRPGADVLLKGNILDPDLFPPSSFDVVIAISVIEHVGIGRYGDPRKEDGDSVAMANIHRWVKPNGVLYMDVPYRPTGPSTPFRQYNESDLQRRVIQGWTEIDREHFDVNHPDAPYVALVLKP